jgi:alginate O-acetyltransferase complex protein AlgI
MFKKFVVADALALIAFDPVSALRTESTLWTWVALYAYAFRIYYDFAGYSDIAIGLGRLAGFSIPENFDRPYSKSNLTLFWNSWHMTLSNWFRAYYFNPISRDLRQRARTASPALIIAFSQITTMFLIGLWHGVSWNFALWGLWHGIGLFMHNRYANATRVQARKLESQPRLARLVHVLSVLLTFHYVALGWVWFALPDFGTAWRVFLRLFGIG